MGVPFWGVPCGGAPPCLLRSASLAGRVKSWPCSPYSRSLWGTFPKCCRPHGPTLWYRRRPITYCLSTLAFVFCFFAFRCLILQAFKARQVGSPKFGVTSLLLIFHLRPRGPNLVLKEGGLQLSLPQPAFVVVFCFVLFCFFHWDVFSVLIL